MNIVRALLLLAVVPLVAACASGPKPEHERGWIGGELIDVARGFGFSNDVVRGMPESAPGDAGALVADAGPDTPLAKAGLVPSDLVLTFGGEPVAGGEDLRERSEALAPGSHAAVTYWRAGEVRTADVVVGRETYEDVGTFTIALSLALYCDLWPFDDGFNLFGLVRWTWDENRRQLDSGEALYRREVAAPDWTDREMQEKTDVFVIPLGVARGKRVLRQETLP